MVPIYKAQTFERIIEKGGRNKPWIVSVDTPIGIEPYVVKLFSIKDIQTENALCKEVYGSAYARELGLNTPDFCLIEFSEPFYDSLPDGLKQIYNAKHNRYAFGSYYLEGAPTYSASNNYSDLADYEIETIYAFDVVIRNVDRRLGKPNILLFEKEAYLIDHEHSLTIKPGDTPEKLLGIFPYQNHIFHSVLKNRMRRSKNKPVFDTFLERFRYSRADCIIECADVLRSLGYDTDDSLVIELYLDRLRTERNMLSMRLIGSLK